MVARAAVRSLVQVLDEVLHPARARGRRIYHNGAQLRSLREKVSFILDYLQNSDYRKIHSDVELENLETKIRTAAFRAKYVIDSEISNQILEPIADAFTRFTSMLSFGLIVSLLYVDSIKLSANLCAVLIFSKISNLLLGPTATASTRFTSLLSFGLIVALLYVTSRTSTSLSIKKIRSSRPPLPVSSRKVLVAMFRKLSPYFILSVLVAFVGYLIYSAAIREWTSFARYWQYASQPENQELRGAIDDFDVIMEQVIEIMDAVDLGEKPDSQRAADSASGLSRWDLGGIGKNVVVGLDDELEEIYDRLLGDRQELQIVSVVGMGGIGKSTLAKQVHDDPRIVYHFDLCAWITVTQEYSLRNVMLGLLDSAKIQTPEVLKKHKEKNDDVLDQKLGQHLYKNLMNRRYLIVMDDVWDTKVWDFVRMFFPDNSNGSRVFLTTRLSEVATYANLGSDCINMRFLNDDYSWDLLRERVFGGEACPPEIEAIGRTIARNCKGLPLAIVVVGGLLYNEHRTLQDWERVSSNLNTILSEDDKQCPEILGLSYTHLPHSLKPCFLYMGSFREDEEIHVARLFNLWVAEGFLEASKDESLEEVAEEYLKDLIQRSLIVVGKWSCNGKIKTCKIHDLVRDFCRQKALKENFLYSSMCGTGLDNHLMLHDEDFCWRSSTPDLDNYLMLREVRTFFAIGSDIPIYPTDFFKRYYVMAHSLIFAGGVIEDLSQKDFRLLRVLDLALLVLHEFPDGILKLVHLRYLAVTSEHHLPSAISRLWNLQTIVHNYRRLKSANMIPVEIWSLPNLRHLYFSGDFLSDAPVFRFQLHRNSPVLENLQALVGVTSCCTKDILKSFPHLKKLGICFYDSRFVECQLESLVNLHQLQTLKFSIRTVYTRTKLAFPLKLKELSLRGCQMPWEWMTAVGALPDLRVLKLKNYAFEGQIWEPVEGEFCQLIFLLVDNTDLEEWRADESHFPRLQRLVLRRCDKLQEIPFGIGEIPTLKRIELVDCHPNAVASAKLIQEEQESMGNEDLKIHTEERG